jgi:hypothetical protein
MRESFVARELKARKHLASLEQFVDIAYEAMQALENGPERNALVKIYEHAWYRHQAFVREYDWFYTQANCL